MKAKGEDEADSPRHLPRCPWSSVEHQRPPQEPKGGRNLRVCGLVNARTQRVCLQHEMLLSTGKGGDSATCYVLTGEP